MYVLCFPIANDQFAPLKLSSTPRADLSTVKWLDKGTVSP